MDELLLKMLCKSVDAQTFQDNKEQLKAGFDLNNSKANTDAAASFLFSNLLSVRGTGSTFKTNATKKVYREKLDAIAPLCERLKDTEIRGVDALELINEYMEDKDAIFIIAPHTLTLMCTAIPLSQQGMSRKISIIRSIWNWQSCCTKHMQNAAMTSFTSAALQ